MEHSGASRLKLHVAIQTNTFQMLCGKNPNIARGNDIFTLTILRNKILACQLAIEMSSGKGNNESESKHA